MTISEEVAAIEDKRLAALCAGDAATLATLLGEDVPYVHSNGKCESKAECVRLLESRHRVYERMQVLERKVIPYDGFVVTSGILDSLVQVAGKPKQTTVRFTGVYTKQGGSDWLLVGWHATAVPVAA